MSTSINIIKIIKSTTTSGSGRSRKIYEQLKKDPEEEEIIDSITSSMNISDIYEDVKMMIPKTMMILHRHDKAGVVKAATNFNGLIRNSLVLF